MPPFLDIAYRKEPLNMKATLYEIAKKAGVSISTVSRALNNDKSKPVSKSTAEKILKIAYEVGYLSPEPAGSKPFSAGTQKSHTLLCLLSNTVFNYNDYFYTEIINGIEEEAVFHGYQLSKLLSSTELDSATTRRVLEKKNYDGVILLGRFEKPKVEFIKTCTSNIIYAGLNRINAGFDEVICDAYDAVNSIVDYLVGCGHRHLGFIGLMTDESASGVNEHRFTAYKDALARHKLPLELGYCKNVELKSDLAYHAAMELAKGKQLPDAIVCATDYIAIAVISALRNCGIRVPEDVSVVGHDDMDLSEFMEPKLTTTNMQQGELGKFAVKILIDRINGRHQIPVLVKLPFKLKIRDSCRERKGDG